MYEVWVGLGIMSVGGGEGGGGVDGMMQSVFRASWDSV